MTIQTINPKPSISSTVTVTLTGEPVPTRRVLKTFTVLGLAILCALGAFGGGCSDDEPLDKKTEKDVGIDAGSDASTTEDKTGDFPLSNPGINGRVFASPGGEIDLQWDPVPGATSYTVYVDGAVAQAAIPAQVTSFEFSTSALTSNQYGPHTWRVIAVTAGGELSSIDHPFTIAEAVDGTTGAPMGGIGTGTVKFCPWKGEFAFTPKTPSGQQVIEHQPNWLFQLYTNRQGTVESVERLSAQKNGDRYDDDVVFPVHYANLGDVNSVSVRLKTVSPWDLDDVQKMLLPVVFYEFTVRNNLDTPVDVATAMRVSVEELPTAVAGSGFHAGGLTERALYAASSDANAIISVGGNDATATGNLDNTLTDTLNSVAAKVTLNAWESKRIVFALTWFSADTPEHYYYTNLASSAKEVADKALPEWEGHVSRATEYVERYRNSNVPAWLVNSTLNTTLWTNNVSYIQDGRFFIAEGIYFWDGQMDQGWHGFSSMIRRIPEVMYTWENASHMEYWARTIMVDGDEDGQISHDFCVNNLINCGGLSEWDDPGYHGWGDETWADLNCGFIIGLWESYTSTGEKARMDYFWPYIKKTGDRLYRMISEYHQSPTYPFTFEGTNSTYDKGPMDDDLYNTGLTITAFDMVSKLAKIYGETEVETKFADARDKTIEGFRARWIQNLISNVLPDQETPLTGQWVSLRYKLGQHFTDDELGSVFDYLFDKYWKPLELGLSAAVGEDDEVGNEMVGWVPYIISHLGLAALETGRINEWRALHKDYYDRYFENRDKVFNASIYLTYMPRIQNYASETWDGDRHYCSLPVVWHSYYEFIGFEYNAATDELYIEPKLPASDDKWGPSMNHELKQAFFETPDTAGTFDYTETGETFANKEIQIQFDDPTPVQAIYVTDNFAEGTTVVATVNGVAATVERVGVGTFEKKIKINWSGNIDVNGIQIAVSQAK